MKTEFQEKEYSIVPNFFTKEECDELYSEYKKYCEELKLTPTKVTQHAFNAYQIHSHVLFTEKLCMILPRVVEIVGESLLPTYALGRFYTNKGYLQKHKDRPACEVSVTINLYQDKPWGIWIKPRKENEEAKEIIQNTGDALFYSGYDLPHWRNSYNGNEYCQGFFHYVRSRGRFAQHYFDRTQMHMHNHDRTLKGL
jgi:hypothetical protein